MGCALDRQRVQHRTLEYQRRALRLQRYSSAQAVELIRRFDRGEPSGFVFHFTNRSGAVGILRDKRINRTDRGFSGPGVYAATLSNPSWFRRAVPLWGYGIPCKRYRIPICLNRLAAMQRNSGEVEAVTVLLPRMTMLIVVKQRVLPSRLSGLSRDGTR